MFVFLHWYLVVDALMAATVIVILDVVPNALSQARHVVLRVDIDIFRLVRLGEITYEIVDTQSNDTCYADNDSYQVMLLFYCFHLDVH